MTFRPQLESLETRENPAGPKFNPNIDPVTGLPPVPPPPPAPPPDPSVPPPAPIW